VPQTPRAVFARIGWMRYYRGSRSDDERPVGGGAYNKVGRGHEICNYKMVNGKLYGFFAAPGRDLKGCGVVNLERIVPGITGDEVDGVTVIFIATDPTADPDTERERIIGWYRDATVLRICKNDPTGQRRTVDPSGDTEPCLYNLVAEESKAVLLPLFRRKHAVPRGKGGMGQANARYLYDENGLPLAPDWIWKAISYVKSYNGENWLTNQLAELPRAAESEREIAAGYESNPEIRRAVEARAMHVVWKQYEKDHFQVEDKSATECFDLLCTKGVTQVRVEVKGTRTDGTTVSLTGNEVKLAAEGDVPVDLCVVHSIRITDGKNIKAHGGTLVRYANWTPRDHELRPVHYECRLFRELAAAV
jgi:hypothetical protein